MPYAANIAVEIAGVTVILGDYIYADRAGAVVIPANSIDQVLAEARAVESEDSRTVDHVRGERPEDFRQ